MHSVSLVRCWHSVMPRRTSNGHSAEMDQMKTPTASGRVLSMGQWSKTSSVREVRPVRAGHQGGLFGPMSPR